jgi:hypothetical protein
MKGNSKTQKDMAKVLRHFLMERHRKVFLKMINHMALSKKLTEKVFMSGKVNILKENLMVYSNAFAKISYGKKKKVQWE